MGCEPTMLTLCVLGFHLAGDCCLEEQERVEYVPSARTTVDAELLQQPSTCLQDSPSQQERQQQGQPLSSQPFPLDCGDASCSSVRDEPTSDSLAADATPAASALAEVEATAMQPSGKPVYTAYGMFAFWFRH